jgi:hypothetical protein
MAWRVIVRVSYFNDQGSALRNSGVAPILQAMGLQNTATGTWESSHCNEQQVAQQMTQLFSRFANPQQGQGVAATAALKHVWIYVDRVAPGDQDDDAA